MCNIPIGEFRLTSDTFEDEQERVIISCPVVICNFWKTVPEFTTVAELEDLVREHQSEGIW